MFRIAIDRAAARRLPVVAPSALIALLTLSCGESTEPRRATALAILTAPPATAQSGVVLGQPIVVELRDQEGAAFAQAGTVVTVTIGTGGGTLAGTTTQPTNADGRATFADLAIGGTVGPRTLRFAADGLVAATSTTITLTPGPAATLEASSAVALQATVATAVTTLPAVVVKDASGNGVSGVPVTFAVSTGGGDLTGASQMTNAAGVATLGGWTLPTTAGQHTVTATTNAVSGSGVAFTATANADVPNVLQRGGFAQVGLYGSRLGTPLVLRVLDRFGNPNIGVVVTWGSVTGAGTAEPINVATDANGFVRANYRLGTTPGENVVRASINAHQLSADYSVTALGFTNEIAVSITHSCGLDELGVAYCWGRNNVGQVGDGTTTDRTTPTPVGGPLRFRRISVGNGTTCALTIDDVPYCWGANTFAAVGDGTTTDRLVPTAVVGGHRFAEISTSGTVSCGQTIAGAGTFCWGSNELGHLGVGSTPVEACNTSHSPNFPCSRSPLQVDGGRNFASLAAATSHVCGLTAARELYCWGHSPSWGGQGTGGVDAAPVRADAGFTFERMTAGSGYTCGIVEPNSAYCWGAGNHGALGTGTTNMQVNNPTPVANNIAAVRIDAGTFGTCAIVTDGRAFCWGFNDYGGVGDGTTTTRNVPSTVSSGATFTAISASGFHSCGRIANGQVYCWGNNVNGELGNGGGANQLTPVLARP
jgi:alpha-tubulin suppressor-like RCC1 family protein